MDRKQQRERGKTRRSSKENDNKNRFTKDDEWGEVSSPEFLGKVNPPVRTERGSTFDRRAEIAFPPSMDPLGGASQR